MLEHTAMYFNVSLCEDDSSPFPDFYTRLGPCELQDPVWAKMSALAAGVKKRKKSETKPQAQINKCNNEKRRREQENIYIEELAELISANFADMSSLSVKPDKCAILQETVNQIRSIKQREGGSQSSDPVQQGEVSSSRPAILSTDVYGPLLLEALEGFLFVVNAEGKVEHVTKNVSNYIKYTEEEVLGKSIYNFIHHGDHARFSSSLLPMSIGWASEPTNKSRSFSCRLLVKSSDDPEDSVDDKQQHGVRYELMHISSTQLGQGTVNDDESGDSGPCLLCVASRMTYRDRAAFASIDSFTTKLDTTGKIIGVDTSGVSSYCQFLNKDLMGRALQELCAQQDVHKLTQHLRDTLSAGQATSVVYRLRIGQDKFLHVQTKSKLFKSNPHSNETDFIMATHSIMGENDSSRPSDPGGGGGGGNNSNVGGPLMTSVVNGTRNGPPINTTSENSTSINNTLLHNTNSTVYTSFSLENEFIFDNITSNWEIPWQEPRPDSRQSVTPVSTPTPRPPSAPTYSPGTTVAQSPITQFVTQPSPSVPNPSTPANAANLPYNSTFVFSPAPADVEEQKDTKAIVLEEPSTMMADSGRLRTLLTKRQDSADSANDSDKKNRILKTLLNQHDEDENVNESRNSPRGNVSSGRNSISSQSELPKTNTSSGGNNMLLQLLNEKSDDEDREARAGIRKQSELLQQLLKDDEPKTEMPSEDDHLLRSLGFPPSDESRGRKRPSDDRDDTNSKRSSDGVSSSGSSGSKLCERNKMLASLLAKQPNNSQPIPPIPNSVITATPQEKLPRIIPDPNTNKTLPNNNRMIQNMQSQNVLSNARTTTRLPGRPSSNTTTYLNQMLTPGDNNIQRSQNRQFNQIDSNSFSSPATSSTETVIWDSQSSDQILSHILDEVLDTVQDDTNILTLLEPSHTNSNSYQQTLNEKIAINRIQKSLMQCETAVNNSPSSPTITLPMTPPAYSTVAMTAQTSQAGFPPPPNYPCNFNVQRAAVRPGVGGAQQYPAGITQQQQQLLYQRKLVQQQQRERDKRRLLQQQQQQQLLIPSNVQVDMQTQDLQNIGSLLNNTVAPNVSLQRSSSVPESQLSPNYGGQTQRLNSQQPYSPHSQLTSPLGQASGFTQTTVSNFQQHGTARLSPHPPAFTQQLSPRQAYPQGTTQNSTNWQQNPPRLSVQQQQNPMLNAQLTGNYVAGSNSRNFPVQRAPQQQQRAIGSPGAAAATRHSPFPADTFAPPGSPNSTSFNQNQYLRLQRANSAPTAPTATTQLPGGLGSPRPYGRDHPPHSYPIPQPHHSMMYQQDSQYCYDQTGLQLSYNGADRGRIPPHLQAGVSGSGTTSEYVRQELRNVVGARAGQTQPANNRSQNTLHQAVNSDLDLGGLGYEMPTSGASESPKLWGAMGSDMGSMSPQPATSRTTMEEARQGDHSARSSLLQKLLSE